MTDDEASQASATRHITVVDAVCCVHFCAAGKSSLLLGILRELGMEILIPAEVEREVLQKGMGQTGNHWPKMRASQHVQILPELTVTPPDQRTDVVANVARVRGMGTQLALSTRANLGEAVVIGHAKVLADAGHQVWVAIDDQGAQVLASNEGLDVLTIEDLLLAGVQLGLITGGDLRRTYEALVPFGSGLPTWDASTLKPAFANWKRSQRSQQAEGEN